GYALNHQVVLYCWRGGMRSGALSAVADLMRIPVYRLSHGYKGYRSYVNDYMQQMPAFSVYVLCGNTGVGKTEVLQELAAQGVQTLDLEGLANHRGSAFGSVGLGAQGSQKAFESGLWQKISQFDVTKPVVLECESRRIGRLLLPEHLHQLVRQATPILLYDNVPNRVARILADYQPAQEPAEVARALACIRPKLGKEKYDLLAAALEQQAYPLVIETLLSGYYDLLYQYPNGADARYPLAVDVAAGHGAAARHGAQRVCRSMGAG
ncbi:MAG: tRNA 2-selenouridine(34) synthase MnmH, partial [Clostridiales bacterium]